VSSEVNGSLLVGFEDGLGSSLNDLLESNVETIDQLDSRGGEVRGLASFISFHDREPFSEGTVVVGNGGSAAFIDTKGTLRDNEDGKTRGNTNSLLGSS
jgi:hypothetical protein